MVIITAAHESDDRRAVGLLLALNIKGKKGDNRKGEDRGLDSVFTHTAQNTSI